MNVLLPLPDTDFRLVCKNADNENSATLKSQCRINQLCNKINRLSSDPQDGMNARKVRKVEWIPIVCREVPDEGDNSLPMDVPAESPR